MFSPEELKRILQESDVIKNVSIIKEAKLFECLSDSFAGRTGNK